MLRFISFLIGADDPFFKILGKHFLGDGVKHLILISRHGNHCA